MGMAELWTTGLDNLYGPFHLPGKLGVSPCFPLLTLCPGLAFFRESCHGCPADRRICATVPSACLRWRLALGVVYAAGLGHSCRGRSCRLHRSPGLHAHHGPGPPRGVDAQGALRLWVVRDCPWSLVPQNLGPRDSEARRLLGLKGPLSPAPPFSASLCC